MLWESLGLQGDPTSPFWRRSVLGIHWKDWCWSWNSSTLATWCEERVHLKRTWCWGQVSADGKGDDRGWYGCMASLTQWTWVWVNYGSRWWTGMPVLLHPMCHKESDMTERLNWRNEILLFATTSMKLEEIMLKKIIQKEDYIKFIPSCIVKK